ncbi:hypothetical protein RSJ21_09450 [Clostridium botulinum]|uniref:hypothetical protein n=1 Tax=Clostridium botulinum TaxID=1491 RepID=UPI000C782AD7|nr:hypothetical protein [Clostridium botulinum]AUN23157.1 hypothetical protein RSJ22_17600 [Clostridium botulinum]AUN25464.1 hypothetical protein RSJ21_09450 [Clostridium botulinum]MBY6900501.1 hypothetical protein [Clostridium botulinum]MBY6914816.1 hypothetical protein [Clostridium botulinum]NFO72180.1 hypothetical protein [Clostridium botulinum]
MIKYAILNKDNIAESIATYYTELFDSPKNYIEVESDDLMWRKYDFKTKSWSEEKFEPTSNAPLNEFEKLKKENEELKQAIAELSVQITMQNNLGGM